MLTNTFLFVGYPYLMMVLAVLVSIIRYRYTPFSFSSLSSQFLENDQLYWGSNLWHWGIIIVLLGHFFCFLFPGAFLAWNANPLRLFGAICLSGALRSMKKRLDPDIYGGAPLLGVNGTVIITHGSSSHKAIFHAIRVSAEAARTRVYARISDQLASLARQP